MWGGSIRFGMFSISLVLVPIVVGAALYGRLAGVWLGFAFGMIVLLSGDAAAYLFLSLAGSNFLLELAVNMLLAPAILRILRAAKWQK